ncbi:hypothetical protein HV213_04915 [Klebsiella sp. RHBSTW-00484]|uniref:hypothetical protein n=1 Tax=unclassified Klebsiella TaxID=2608929 RepID=UPI0015E4BC78|nr:MULTISPECIES: hypothetical protein [unclassified Klebsiella]MBA7845335.1 hypothetical protein [Klebsiella sp. RHBSTW-00465]QLO35233.1 hypothetical protein HV213_04915 [Klebsiella sp. RHBSTW-00484]QLT74747.1 hypothetical protein HV204_04915 [Klebsiella sp. RHBSTW-00464]
MPFVKVEVTPEESEALLLRDEELNRVYQETGGGHVTTADVALPRYWFINEDEDASFCLLCLGSTPGYNPRKLYILRVKKNYIILGLYRFRNIQFLHDSPLLNNEIYKIKYLITAALSVAGQWGDGDTDGVNGVPDPIFEFAPGMRS